MERHAGACLAVLYLLMAASYAAAHDQPRHSDGEAVQPMNPPIILQQDDTILQGFVWTYEDPWPLGDDAAEAYAAVGFDTAYDNDQLHILYDNEQLAEQRRKLAGLGEDISNFFAAIKNDASSVVDAVTGRRKVLQVGLAHEQDWPRVCLVAARQESLCRLAC